MLKCLDTTRVSGASTRPARQEVDLLIRSLSLPYFNRIGCHGPCGMTLVFCSLRHYTGPHSVFSVGWLLPPQPHPCHSFSPSTPPARLRTPALTDKVPSRNRTKGTTLREDPSGPKKERHRRRPRAASPWQRGSDKAAWAMGLPLHVLRMRQQPMPLKRQRAQRTGCPRSTFCNGPSVSPSTFFPSSEAAQLQPCACQDLPMESGLPCSRYYTRDCCAVECLSAYSTLHAHRGRPGCARQNTRRPRVLIHFRVDPQATAANPVTAPLADERPCDQSLPRLPSCRPPPGHPSVHTLRHGR